MDLTKIGRKLQFLLKSFSNFNSGFLFLISISKFHPYKISSKSDKNSEVGIFLHYFTQMEPKIEDGI